MALEQFHHTFRGQEITLPHYKHIPVGVVRRLRKENEAEQLFGLLEAVATPDALEVIDQMGAEDLQEMMAVWQAASRVSMGESSASAT